jgi:LAS superfamily LD-carboxypeptidase LdcB
MSPLANVKSLEALSDWKSGLKLFVHKELEMLKAAAYIIQQAREWLEERVAHWKYVVRRCEEAVQNAVYNVNSCYASGSSSCEFEEEELRSARRRLAEAEDELNIAITWQQRVEEAAQDYDTKATRLEHVLTEDMSKADTFMVNIIDKLQEYVVEKSGSLFQQTIADLGQFLSPAPAPAVVPKVISSDELEGIAQTLILHVPDTQMKSSELKPIPPKQKKIPLQNPKKRIQTKKKLIPQTGPNSAWQGGEYIGELDLVPFIDNEGNTEYATKNVLDAWNELAKEAEINEGFTLELQNSFRTYERQKQLFEDYQKNKKIYEKKILEYNEKKKQYELALKEWRANKKKTVRPVEPKEPKKPAGANPPGLSAHQNGTAIDIAVWDVSSPEYQWLTKHGPEHGFIRTVGKESWHWEYRPEEAKRLSPGQYMRKGVIDQYLTK